jgi:hypothetical protein
VTEEERAARFMWADGDLADADSKDEPLEEEEAE